MTWDELFISIKNKEYCKKLNSFLDEEYANKTIYPPRKDMFNAFKYTPLEKVKVVIIGQDPYPNPNQAMGIAFSVPNGVILPPSLRNIYKEIELEYPGKKIKSSGDLRYLSTQGVLLLNPILTVVAHNPLSHKCKEYDEFFKEVMLTLNNQNQPMVFLLWGGNARKYHKYLTNNNHLVLESAHPSPLSANQGGWFHNNHFIKTNEYLSKNGLTEINWIN